MKSIVRSISVAVLTLGLASSASAAPMLLGTTGNGTTISTLVELDPVTGALINTIGSIGYTVNGLTYDSSTGILYGSTGVTGSGYNGLITIDMNTGAGTAVAGFDGWGLGGRQAITNIATDAAGNMFGWWDPSADDLVSINKATGVATHVGDSGQGTGANGLSFDNDGTLWMVNCGGCGNLFTVNPGTGGVTFAGDIGTTAHHGDFNPVTNLYYGITSTGSGAKTIVLADLDAATVVGSFGTINDLHTLTFVPDAVVPEPGSLLLFGAGLAGVAVKLRRRRQ